MSLTNKIKSLYSNNIINENMEYAPMTPDQVEQYIVNGYSVFLSADPKRTPDQTDQEFELVRKLRQYALNNTVKQSQFNFVTGEGNYQYEDGTPSTEPMVMMWTEDKETAQNLVRFAKYLMKRFTQESIGICEKNQFYLLYNDGRKEYVGQYSTNVGNAPYSTTINGLTFTFGN